jgi:hypothetical protein
MEEVRIRYRPDIRTRVTSTPQGGRRMGVFKKQFAICIIIGGVLAGVAHSQADGATRFREFIQNNLQYSVDYDAMLSRIGDIYSTLFRRESRAESVCHHSGEVGHED